MHKQVKAPDINTCANPDCEAVFLRLGEGCLSVLPVQDSAEWGLPEHVKQKVVWICDRCSSRYYVRLDRKHHVVQLVNRPRQHVA